MGNKLWKAKLQIRGLCKCSPASFPNTVNLRSADVLPVRRAWWRLCSASPLMLSPEHQCSLVCKKLWGMTLFRWPQMCRLKFSTTDVGFSSAECWTLRAVIIAFPAWGLFPWKPNPCLTGPPPHRVVACGKSGKSSLIPEKVSWPLV